MRGKITLGGSGRVAELVASGEVEMAVQQISELLPVHGRGLSSVRFRRSCSFTPCFRPASARACKEPEAAKAFIDALAAPSAASLFKANGLEPTLR